MIGLRILFFTTTAVGFAAIMVDIWHPDLAFGALLLLNVMFFAAVFLSVLKVFEAIVEWAKRGRS